MWITVFGFRELILSIGKVSNSIMSFFFFSELKKKRPGLNDKLKKDLSLCKG